MSSLGGRATTTPQGCHTCNGPVGANRTGTTYGKAGIDRTRRSECHRRLTENSDEGLSARGQLGIIN